MKSHLQKIKDTLHRYKRWEPLVFFVGGFTFDAFLLHRIDDPLMLIHQALYLTLSASIIAWDLFTEVGSASPPRWLGKLWGYRAGILHFLLGTLLNVYTIFYFKSGTLMSSLLFLAMLGGMLFLNEARPVAVSKHILRNALFGLCLLSYMNIVISILVGSIGPWVFLLAIAAAGGVMTLFIWFLKSRLETAKISREIRLPFLIVALIYTLLYFLKILPPVPMSVKKIGIYHEIAKVGDTYQLGYEHPAWMFWESGDQTFDARPGQKIYCFVQIFSPTQFHDRLFVRWLFRDPKHGWTSSDAIPLDIVGGRAEGYRGYTTKSNYQAGDWRVSVETGDGREVGRIGFQVQMADASQAQQALNYEVR